MNKTGIEYLTHTWNPIAMRCSPVSEGCGNCWHLAMCKRHVANPYLTAEVRAAKAGGPPVLLDGELDAPSRLRKPARIGVQLMGDLFHPSVPEKWIDQVMARVGLAGQHTFVMLTKRSYRMAHYFAGGEPVRAQFPQNLWLGVTVENQRRAGRRIGKLREVPAAVKLISFEPLLETIHADLRGIDWVVLGLETGPNRRHCHSQAFSTLIDEADRRSVRVFVKTFPVNGRVSFDPADWPKWARRREFPKQES